MNKVLPRRVGRQRGLQLATVAWFVATTLGMWLFVYYLILNYALPVLDDGLSSWTDTRLTIGFVPGVPASNIAVGIHVLLAIVTFGPGPLQLVPILHRSVPRLHRLNGRLFAASAVAGSLSGLYMVWARGDPRADVAEHVGTSLNAVCILVCAAAALRFAIGRDIARHRRWATHLFLAAGGTFFVRVLLGMWFLADIDDPSLFKTYSILISFGQTLIPLSLYEYYRYAQRRGVRWSQFVVAAILGGLTAVTVAGVYKTYHVLWLPQLR